MSWLLSAAEQGPRGGTNRQRVRGTWGRKDRGSLCTQNGFLPRVWAKPLIIPGVRKAKCPQEGQQGLWGHLHFFSSSTTLRVFPAKYELSLGQEDAGGGLWTEFLQ